MNERKTVLGVTIDNISPEQALARAKDFIAGQSVKTIYTPNPEFLLNAREDSEFKDILNRGDLVIADGIGVILCSVISGKKLRQRVRGVDLVQSLLKSGVSKPFSIYLLGASEKNSAGAAASIPANYPGITVAGRRNGYYDISGERALAEEINSAKPQLLLVALGSPRQERFIEKYKDCLANVRCAIGVGGTIDILSGNVKLAPNIFRKTGFEWLYRLVSEPKRFKRIIRLPLVLLYALAERFRR